MPTVGKIGSADFFDEHGLDAGLSRPGRKNRQGDALTKQGLFRHSDESGRFIVPGLTETTGGLDTHWGSGSYANSGKNRQRRFFDEHGLDAGLSRPGRKNRQGDALTKQGCSDTAGSVGIGSADEIGEVGRIGSRCWR
nr:uncharacterized protein LOC118033987 [Populus alba]